MDTTIIVFQCENGFIMFITIYMLVILTHNLCTSSKEKVKSYKKKKVKIIVPDKHLKIHKLEKEKYYYSLNFLFISVCSLILLSTITQQILYLITIYFTLSNDICDVLIRIQLLSVTLASLLQYTMLWLKQKALYIHSLVRDRSYRCTEALSWFLLFFFIFGLMIVLAIFFYNFSFSLQPNLIVNFNNATNISCQIIELDKLPSNVLWFSVTIYYIFISLSFFVLFAQPLLFCRTKVASLRSTVNVDSSIFSVSKYCLACTCICILSNIVATGASYILNDSFLIFMILNLSACINLILSFVTFQNWKVYLFPCYQQFKPTTVKSVVIHQANKPKMSQIRCVSTSSVFEL